MKLDGRGHFLHECTHGFTSWMHCPHCCSNLADVVPDLLREIQDLKKQVRKTRKKKKSRR